MSTPQPGTSPPTLQAAIFDLDGVLADTAQLHAAAWRRLAGEVGLSVDDDLLDDLRGRSRTDSLQALLGGREVDAATFADWMARKDAWYVASLEELTPADALPGAHDCLRRFSAAGWKMAVGSSSRNARVVLDRLGLQRLLDVVVDGSDVEVAKPAPDIFLLAAQRLKVAAEACVVIEDAAAGVAAAQRAGMRVVGVAPSDAPLAGVDLHVSSVVEFTPDMLIEAFGSRG